MVLITRSCLSTAQASSSFKWLDTFMHLSILCPTTPLPGYVEKRWTFDHFDTKTCPIHGEFDCSPYARATIKSAKCQIPHLLLDCWVGRRLGFDRLACPIGGAFELCNIQIPTYRIAGNFDGCWLCKYLMENILTDSHCLLLNTALP